MKISYTSKWVIQRVTALFLIPLSFWFIYQCMIFQELEYFELKLFFQSYLNSLLFIIMMIVMLVHAKLGCETVITDYVSSPPLKILFKSILNFISYFSLFLVVIAIIKLSIF